MQPLKTGPRPTHKNLSPSRSARRHRGREHFLVLSDATCSFPQWARAFSRCCGRMARPPAMQLTWGSAPALARLVRFRSVHHIAVPECALLLVFLVLMPCSVSQCHRSVPSGLERVSSVVSMENGSLSPRCRDANHDRVSTACWLGLLVFQQVRPPFPLVDMLVKFAGADFPCLKAFFVKSIGEIMAATLTLAVCASAQGRTLLNA